jgi:hypothetical protein
MKFLFILATVALLSGCSNALLSTCSHYIDTDMFSDSENELIDLNSLGFDFNDGNVVCIESGVYRGLLISDLHFIDEKLTVQPTPRDKVIFVGKNYSGAGVRISNATGVRIQGFSMSKGMYGIYTTGSSMLELLENTITDVGQEGIVVKAGSSANGVSNITIANNLISNTGRRIGQYGEGIYIGDAKGNAKSLVSEVHIYQNILVRTKNEAIDIKSNTRDIQIIANTIIATDLKFNGAITLAVNIYHGEDSNFLVKNNKIIGVSNRSGYRPMGIAVGQGNASITNNLIVEKNINFVGICLFSTFTNQVANLVNISENEIVTRGKAVVERCADGGTGAKNFGKVVK